LEKKKLHVQDQKNNFATNFGTDFMKTISFLACKNQKGGLVLETGL